MTTIALGYHHKTAPPSWSERAFSLFTNFHGEQWLAFMDNDRGLVIAGGDMDWREIVADWDELHDLPNRQFPASMGRVVLNTEERLWLSSVVCVATETIRARRVFSSNPARV